MATNLMITSRSSPSSSLVSGMQPHLWPQYLVLAQRLTGTSTALAIPGTRATPSEHYQIFHTHLAPVLEILNIMLRSMKTWISDLMMANVMVSFDSWNSICKFEQKIMFLPLANTHRCQCYARYEISHVESLANAYPKDGNAYASQDLHTSQENVGTIATANNSIRQVGTRSVCELPNSVADDC